MVQIKGDTLKYQFTVDKDITDWKIRAQLSDAECRSTKIATTNSGGSDDQIAKSDIGASESVFHLLFASGTTNDFQNTALLEVEVDTGQTVNGQPEIITIYQGKIKLSDEQIDWTDPTA